MRARRNGFAAYILGSGLFLVWGISISAWPLVIMHTLFLGLNVRGFLANTQCTQVNHK